MPHFRQLLAFALCAGLAFGAIAQEPPRITREQRLAVVAAVNALRAQQSPLLHGGRGVVVSQVLAGSQAARLGVVSGDVIVRYAGEPARTNAGLVAAINAMAATPRPVEIVLLRNGANLTVTAQTGRLGVGLDEIVWLDEPAQAVATPSQVFPQLGHPVHPANAVAFSPDGRLAASGGAENTIKLWDVATGREIKTMAGHTGMVSSLAFHPNGRFILSGSYDKTASLWDVATGRQMYGPILDSAVINAVAFSPDGRQAVVGGVDNRLILIDVESGVVNKTIPDPANSIGMISGLAFSPDGRHVAAGSWGNNKLTLWDVAEGRMVRVLSGHSMPAVSVAFSPDGRQVVSGALDKSVRVWEAASGRQVHSLDTPIGAWGVAWSADGRHIASAGGGVRVWDAASGRQLHNLMEPAFAKAGMVMAKSVAFSPDGRTLLAGTHAGDMKLWDVASGRVTGSMDALAFPFSALAVTPDGKRFATAGWRNSVQLWNAGDGKLSQTVNYSQRETSAASASAVRAVAMSPDGRFMLAADNDTHLKLADLATGKEVRVFSGHRGSVAALAISPDGQLAVSAGGHRDSMWQGIPSTQYDGTLRIWRLATGETLRVIEAHTSGIDSVIFSPDGRQILSAASGGARLWDAASGALLRSFEGGARAVAFSPDGKAFLSGWLDLRMMDAATGAVLHKLEGHTNQVFAVAFSPDGRTAASGGMDNSIRLWDVATGKALKTLAAHAGAVKALAFTPDGRQLVSAGDDATLRVWDLARGRPLVQVMSFKDGEWMAMTPEGYFSASSPKAADKLNISQGLNVYGASQFYDVFYRPDIVEAAMAGRDTRGMVALTIDDALRNPPPSVAGMTAPAAGASERVSVGYRIQSAGGGIGEVRIFHNGKLVSSDGVARALPDAVAGHKVQQQTPEALVSQMRSLAGGAPAGASAPQAAVTTPRKPDTVEASVEIEPVPGDNEVSVIAFNAQNSIQSVLRTVSFQSTRAPVAPRLHILAIGIDEYKDKGVSLKFAVKDARDLSALWRSQAANIYGADNILVETLANAQASRAGILAKIDEMAAKVKPTDHFMLFIASHGVLVGEQYYMVTSDYDGALKPALLISSGEIADFSKRIKALSQLYILDTCHAGGMGGVVTGLYDARVSVLARKMGLHMFASASSAEQALDGHEGNGLFTHTLLAGLRNNRQADRNTDQQVSLTELGIYSKAQTHDIAGRLQHKQDPLIINFGQDMPVYKLR